MSRKSRERDLHNAFREWAVDPALYDQFGDEAESSIPAVWPSSARDLPYVSDQSFQPYIYPPDLTYPGDSLTPEELRDESVSSSSPFHLNTHHEPVTIAEPSSPCLATDKKKDPSSSYKTSCRSKKATSKTSQHKERIQCQWEDCGKWFRIPTDLQ
ncbi:predicted protein [Verticillium alfalfae VaMs.102]|uniref:Predicted protein n=1 Tax=Verticillium alfalfae (strain VaMs.102 / ATCC MYA-4576 / FGSC 10136) TaxID=526221 RepID=C9SLK5_VERA1|nr:predicted protein [Verticillium alfalfae VaMs.102]EEY19573.1 predicted protein [Verticillium alfalfae VaMs.102]